MVGTAKGAEAGVLFRDAESLERLGSIATVVVDKTGTLTEGTSRVTDIARATDAPPEDQVLRLVAAAERGSEHPLADAIVRAVLAAAAMAMSSVTVVSNALRLRRFRAPRARPPARLKAASAFAS